MSTNRSTVTNKKSMWPKLIVFSLILGVIVVAVNLLPRGFSQDLTAIGQGTKAVVLVHDGNLLQSADTMVAMNAVRDEFEGRIQFIVADINTPEGRKFANQHGFGPAALAFFAADGQQVQVLYTEQTGETLRKNIDLFF